MKFAKLFDIGEHQVLVTLDEYEGNEPDREGWLSVCARVDVEEFGSIETNWNASEETARRLFDDYDMEQAEKARLDALTFVAQIGGEP